MSTFPKPTVWLTLVFFFLIFLMSTLGWAKPALADGMVPIGPDIVRIALKTGAASTQLKLQQGAYALVDMMTQMTLVPEVNTHFVFSPIGGLNQRVEANGQPLEEINGSLVLLKQLNENEIGLINYEGKPYRGSFMIENKDGKLNIINILDVEKYLYGVLPREMGISTAPAQALEAQAVVSRTYALKKKNVGASYDMSATNSSQVYGGYAGEVAYATQAVDATRGQAIYFDHQLIEAYFSSNAGGYTESTENVWNASLDYAKAVPSPYDQVVLTKAQDSTGWPAYSYQWEKRFTLEQLQEKLNQWNLDHPSNPLQVGRVTGLVGKALAYDPQTLKITDQPNASGRITKLDIIGTQGSESLYKESVRNFLDLRSNLFTIIPEGGTLVRNGAGVVTNLPQGLDQSQGLVANGAPQPIAPKGSQYYIATAQDVVAVNKVSGEVASEILIRGQGFGHGVGFSQWGAIGMAEAGKDFREIIEYYYNQGKNDGRLKINRVAANS